MKQIEIMKHVTNLTGDNINDNDGEPTTIKDIIMQYVSNFTSSGGDYKKAMRTRKTAEAIFEHKIDKLELEDAEFDLIEEAIKSGIPQQGGKTFHHPDIILAQVYEALEKAKRDREDEVNDKT